MKVRGAIFFLLASLTMLCAAANDAPTGDESFREGVAAFNSGDFSKAAQTFRASSEQHPSSGALLDLGLAEWRRGRAGPAVQAWEQVLWLDPFNGAARNNLRYARQFAEMSDPELTWNEAASTWLPTNGWAWIAGGSLWLAVALVWLPGLLRWRRAGWQQALAAASLGIFLLSLPAHVGIVTRAKIGFVLERKVALRLTPTEESETVATLPAGEPARKVGERGEYFLIRAAQGLGWVERKQFGLIAAPARAVSARKPERSP
ncbi:MAG: hypothetical protein EXS35_03285 [Pedosphaera sp.]|nr:hypothetical protein [Pedosphaera sp.]